MKNWLAALLVTVTATTLAVAPLDADARRLGGGRAAGMQRQLPAKPVDANRATPPSPAQSPGNSAAAPAAAGTAAAAAGKRSWLGPLAGLAAGIGLAALFSHLGWGAGLANFVTLALLALLVVVAVRFVMRRIAGAGASGGLRPATEGGAGWSPPAPALPPATAAPAAMPAAAAAVALPAGVDAAEFLRLAKMVFIRLQAANDAGDVDDLRKFTTPELFASLRLDLQDRGGVAQKTDVVQLDAEVADVAREAGRDVVSVRFHGLIREQADQGAAPFDEMWHLVRAADAAGDWAIAGITPIQ